MPVLLLTTTGRKSGKQHTTPLVYMPDGDAFVVIASNSGQARLPNWWLNMRKSKQAQVEVGRKRLRVSVQEASGEERQRLWSRIIDYRAGHEAYQERTPYPLRCDGEEMGGFPGVSALLTFRRRHDVQARAISPWHSAKTRVWSTRGLCPRRPYPCLS
jgi:deazaflavin-dependent oxidoreductase (nitroreductase family)